MDDNKKDEDDFSAIGAKVDCLVVQESYDQLEEYLSQLRSEFDTKQDPGNAVVFYIIGTGYCNLVGYYRRTDVGKRDGFQKLSFYYLRKAIEYMENDEHEADLLLNAYTNYANGLDACGRVIESLRIYRKAMQLDPEFGMAVGNYGKELRSYANIVNDPGHRSYLHWHAYHAFKKAVSSEDPGLPEEARQAFQGFINEYDALPGTSVLEKELEYKQYDWEDEEEKDYRSWCLKRHLFLHPLNDLIEEESAFTHDPLTVTRFTEYLSKEEALSKKNDDPPKWFSMLNQLKEEYIYSRWLCYKGTCKTREVHYADKDVLLSKTSSGAVNYSIRLEQLKSSFKTVFSVFDKIGFVVNEFWELGIKERDAGANNVFNSDKYPKDNIALTALYWSNLEFQEKYGDADALSEKDLRTLRNAFEHKFVKIDENADDEELTIKDDRFYHISERDLEEKTVRLLEIAREWIMEIVYAIGLEERKNNESGQGIQQNVEDYKDEWKT